MQNLCVLVILLTLALVQAARPKDEITVPHLNKTFRIIDETYRFNLVPLYWVPLRISKRIIYTSTTSGIAKIAKRTFAEKRSLDISLSADDHKLLEEYLGELPSFVRVDTKKRSLPPSGGMRTIEIAPDHYFLFPVEHETSKRWAEQVPLGQNACLHIPFFTTCDNSADLKAVKNTIEAQTAATRKEFDSYKATNDARDREMTISLNRQRDIIAQINRDAANNLATIQRMITVSRTNMVNTQHGDYFAHSQVNSLKDVATSLLRFANALTSTDPRATTAQPALTNLFQGFKLVLAQVENVEKLSPITDVRTFDWKEQVLPSDAIQNITTSQGTTSPIPSTYYGFRAVMKIQCVDGDTDANNQYCLFNRQPVTCSPPTTPDCSTFPTSSFVGPFHTDHLGLYQVYLKSQGGPWSILSPSLEATKVVLPSPPTQFRQTLRCIKFLGNLVLAEFDATPDLINGVANATADVLPLEQCRHYQLMEATSVTSYRLFSMTEGLTVPFYSNCRKEALPTTLPTGYFSNYPDTTSTVFNPTADKFMNDLTVKHYVSATCYVNVPPSSIGMSYYIKPALNVIPSIPRGYRINQFTINTLGELSSSLEFLSTTGWGLVYRVERVSTDLTTPGADGNNIIVDEVDLLHGSKVLFIKNNNTIIDESDSMYGAGNNGRDCIQLPAKLPVPKIAFDYDLMECFFQNDQIGNGIQNYLNGLVRSSGISRFNNKFFLKLREYVTADGLPSYEFSLKAREEASFRFYVAMRTEICPQIDSRNMTENNCFFTFRYSGTQTVTLNNTLGIQTVPIGPDQRAVDVPVAFSSTPYTLRAGNFDCLRIMCRKVISSSYIQLDPPSFSLVSQDDLSLQTEVQLSLDRLLTGSLSNLKETERQVIDTKRRLEDLGIVLQSFDFNMSKQFPYKSFKQMREELDKKTADITANYCEGPFASARCWIRDFGATLITFLIIIAILGGIWFCCARTAFGQTLQYRLFGESLFFHSGFVKDDVYTPDGDFHLLAASNY